MFFYVIIYFLFHFIFPRGNQGHLVTIRDEGTQQFVFNVFKNEFHDANDVVWIGLSDQHYKGQHRWMDGWLLFVISYPNLRPRQTVSIASKQNMLFSVPLNVSSGYPHPCISHCVMSCFDLCFWLVCLQLETKHVNTKCNALFQSLFFAYRLTSTILGKKGRGRGIMLSLCPSVCVCDDSVFVKWLRGWGWDD
jgi:hypothetical protein